jgi:hypothetical protein
VHCADKELNLGHWCGTMLELRLYITESYILLSNETNENIEYKVFISNSALLKNPHR